MNRRELFRAALGAGAPRKTSRGIQTSINLFGPEPRAFGSPEALECYPGTEYGWQVATAGQLTLTRAYSHAPATRVGPFIYTAVVFAALLDWLFWGQWPDRLSLAGALLVATAGVLALRVHPEPPPAAAAS